LRRYEAYVLHSVTMSSWGREEIEGYTRSLFILHMPLATLHSTDADRGGYSEDEVDLKWVN
jgi:hypothetical protein